MKRAAFYVLVKELIVLENVLLGDQVTFHYYDTRTCLPNNLVHIDPLVTKPVPLERQQSELSNGTGLVTNGSK